MPDKEIYSLLFPGGGMNQDDNLINFPQNTAGNSLFSQGDYLYARNVRIGTVGNDGAIENVPSTLKIEQYTRWNGTEFTNSSVSPGVNTCIGKCEDVKNNAIYVFCHNDQGNHFIYQFQRVGNSYTVREMLYWSGLNFKADHIISSWMVGPYLFFTSNQVGGVVSNSVGNIANPPRMIDTTSIYKTKYNLGGNFSEFHISLAKWAPQAPAVLSMDFNGDITLKEGLFQFSYRYIYQGGFKSTFAPFTYFYSNQTNGGQQFINISIPGFIFSYNNRVATAFNHANIAFYSVVEYIEIVYRQSETDTWKLFQRYTVQSGSNDGFQFQNKGPSAIIPTTDISQPFDSVPFYSGCGESIDNRSMLADNTDELPVPNFDVSDISVVQSNPYLDNWNTISGYSSLSAGIALALGFIIQRRQFSFKERGIYKLGILFKHWTGRTWQVITLDKWTYRIPTSGQKFTSGNYYFEANNALQFKIPNNIIPPDGAVSYQIVRTNCLNIEFFIHGVCNQYELLQNETNDLNDDVSTPSEIQSILNDYFDNKAISTSRQDRKLSDRIVSFVRKNKTTNTVANASQILIHIENWILPSKKDLSGNADNPHNNLFYTFQKGDRVRFFGNVSGVNYTVFDEEIVEYTGKTLIINKPVGLTDLGGRTSNPGISPQVLFIEVYRPKDITEQPIFYEMGEWYPITQPCTPNRNFSKRDWTWGGPSSVTSSVISNNYTFNKYPIVTGDVWVVRKDFYYDYRSVTFDGTVTPILATQMNPDPKRAYDKWEHNTGRPFLSYEYIPKVFTKKTQVRFGLRYLQDSVFNGLNTFLDENQYIYPEEYGRIRALINTNNAQVESVGNIMLALGEIEVWSIYVNRTTLEDLSGRTTVSISDKVLGSFNTLLGSYGTMNPESWGRRNGRVMWWSQRNGCWVRYSRDGTTDISAYKMAVWFREISDLINPTYDGVPAKCISAYDQYNEIWITLIDDSSMPNSFRGYDSYKSMSFSEKDKRWKSVYDYSADRFSFIGMDVFSIVGAIVYAHERGADYGSFYQVPKPSAWQPVANPELTRSKSWQSIELIATDKWEATLEGDWKSNGAILQNTEITLNDYDSREGAFFSAITRDENSPAGAINGDRMRGRALKLYMELNDIDYRSVLNYLIVRAIDSPRNGKI